MIRFSLFLLFSISLNVAFGQEPATNTLDSPVTKVNALNEVVISTSRTEKEASTEPRSITVINEQQIAASNVKTLPELLAQVESIYITGNGMNPGTNQNISMRGTNTNQTAILLDGILLNDPSSPDGAFDIGDLTLNSVSRIEVVRGSNSTIYGSGAIGGSINIITKEKGDKPFEAEVETRNGMGYNISNAIIRYTDKSGIYASVGLNNINSKGIDAAEDTSSKKPIEPNDLDDFHQTDIIGKIGYDKNKLKLSASIKSLQKFGSIDSAFKNDNNNTLETTRNIYQFKAQYKINTMFTVQGFAAYSLNERTNIDDSSLVQKSPDTTYDHTFFKGTNTGESLQSEVLGIYKKKTVTIVIGAGINNEKMNMESEFINTYSLFPSHTKLNYADSGLMQKNTYGFFHAEYGFEQQGMRGLNIAGGMRYNMNNQYGKEFSFEISPSFTKNGNTVYFTHTNGFLNPSLYQLYANDPTILLMGNKNLKPQFSRSYEGGFKTTVSGTTYFTIAFFKMDIKNPVQYVSLWEKNTSQDSLTSADFRGNTYLNIGTQTNNGIDFSLNIKASDKLSLILLYSHVETKLSVNNIDIDSIATKGHHVQLYDGGEFLTEETETVRLIRRPTNTLNAIIFYSPSSNLSFRLDTRFISSRYDAFFNPNLGPKGALDSKLLNGYTLMDFYVKFFVTNNAALGIKIDNLLNTKYTEIIGFRTRGTMAFFDLQVKL